MISIQQGIVSFSAGALLVEAGIWFYSPQYIVHTFVDKDYIPNDVGSFYSQMLAYV
jgi:hypothetical protein